MNRPQILFKKFSGANISFALSNITCRLTELFEYEFEVDYEEVLLKSKKVNFFKNEKNYTFEFSLLNFGITRILVQLSVSQGNEKKTKIGNIENLGKEMILEEVFDVMLYSKNILVRNFLGANTNSLINFDCGTKKGLLLDYVQSMSHMLDDGNQAIYRNFFNILSENSKTNSEYMQSEMRNEKEIVSFIRSCLSSEMSVNEWAKFRSIFLPRIWKQLGPK